MARNKGSQGNHTFQTIPTVDIPRSVFNRNHSIKTTFNAGDLWPIWVEEAYPGDTINLNGTLFGRFNTPIFPILDNVFLETFFFAVPIRLIWENWEKMNGAQDNPGDSIAFLVPQMVSANPNGHLVGSLSDGFGIPTQIPDLTHSSLWHRAYNLAYNHWFRDQSTQNSLTVDTDDGPDAVSAYLIKKRGKRKDYFTGALPAPQRGAAVLIPIAGTAPVIPHATELPMLKTAGDTGGSTLHSIQTTKTLEFTDLTDNTGTVEWTQSGLSTDLASATGIPINDLRESFQIQRVLELDARGGTRYTEMIQSQFGVSSPDSRLQRVEYLGGGRQMLNISAVPQTSSTDGTSPQGNLSAYGTTAGSGHGFIKSFTEHCVCFGVVCARADINYQHGLNRMFSRRTRYDFYLPSFAHLGEQGILNKEIYAQGSLDAFDDDVFAYIPRFDEMRYKPGMITGEMRSTYATSLDPWHLAQHFTVRPSFDQWFIEEDVPIARVVATPAEADFKLDGYFIQKHARAMPTFAIPGRMDHF